MNEDDAVRAALSQYYDSSRPAGYAAAFRAGWDAGKQWTTTPVCQDCGMRHGPDARSSCIEGHGDDEEWGEDSAAQRLDAATVCADLLVRIVRPMYNGPSGDQGLNDPLYGECLRAIERYKRTR